MVAVGAAAAADIHVFQTLSAAADAAGAARDVVHGADRTLLLAVAVVWRHIITLLVAAAALADIAIHYVTKLLQDM